MYTFQSLVLLALLISFIGTVILFCIFNYFKVIEIPKEIKDFFRNVFHLSKKESKNVNRKRI